MNHLILRTKHNKYRYYAIRCPYKYRMMADKGGYIMYHRLVMAESIGRPLYKTERVIHKDKNTLNNEIENLKIVRRKQNGK